MYDTILVPLDRSPLAESVLPHALAMARAMDARLLLVHVLSLPGAHEHLTAVDPLEWRLRQAEAESYIEDIASRLRGTGVSVEAHILEGDAAEQIVSYARENRVGLTVLSSHGQSGLSGWNVSSVVQKVILRAYTSLLIVRAYQPAEPELTGVRYRRVLVPLDGSQRAECVLPVAASLARAHEAQLLLVHVVQQPEMPRRTPLSSEDSELVERLVERNRSEAADYLSEVSYRLPAGTAETRLLISNHVASTLHQLAEQEDFDLVLLSAHGYSGETRWPYGATVASFVAYGIAPLLIVQDVPLEEMAPSHAEIAAQNYGRR